MTGTVSVSGGGGVADVFVKLTDSQPQIIDETVTASDGTYTLYAPNGSYRVTPSKPAYTFAPAYYDVTISGSDLTGKDFTATGIPWPKFRYDEFNTGQSIYAGPSNGALSWSWTFPYPYNPGGAVMSSPAVASDGTIYFGCRNDDYVYALNSDGSFKWRRATGDWVLSSPAIGSDGTIYIGSYDGDLYALSANGGTVNWTYSTGASISSSPLIGIDGTVYIGSWDHSVYAVNPDGSLRWSHALPDVIHSSAALSRDGAHLYVGCDDGNLYSLSAATGAEQWGHYTTGVPPQWVSTPFPTGGAIESSPAVAEDGIIYIGSDDYKVYAVYPSSGTGKWQFPPQTGGAVKSSPAIGTNGYIYVGSDDGYLYCLKPADGTNQYNPVAIGQAVESSPAIDSAGNVYVGSGITPGSGYVDSYSSDLYTHYWRYTTSDPVLSSPAIGANGILYVGRGSSSFARGALLAIN